MNNDNESDNFISILNSCYDQINKNIENEITNKKDSSISLRSSFYQPLAQHIQKLQTLLYSLKEESLSETHVASKLDIANTKANSDMTDDLNILIQKVISLEKENRELKTVNNEQFSVLNDIKQSVEQLKDEKVNMKISNNEYHVLNENIEESINDISNTSILSEFINGITDIKMGISSELITLKVEENKKEKSIKKENTPINIYSEPETIYLTETMLLNQSLKKILKEKKDKNEKDSYKTPKIPNKTLIPSKYTSNTIGMKNEKKRLFATPQNVTKHTKLTSPSKEKENIYPTPSRIPKGLTPSGKNKPANQNRLSFTKSAVSKVNSRIPLKKVDKIN